MVVDQHGRSSQGTPDAIIAGRAADGDVDAFAVLVRRYTPPMRAHLRRMLSVTSDVDDIVQESFVVGWQRLPDLEDPAKVKSWLMRIATRRGIDWIRSRREQTDIDNVELATPQHSTPPNVAESSARLDALREALRQLPDDQRECWILREIEGLSYEEIADELDVSASTVRGLLARARKQIVARMEGWR